MDTLIDGLMYTNEWILRNDLRPSPGGNTLHCTELVSTANLSRLISFEQAIQLMDVSERLDLKKKNIWNQWENSIFKPQSTIIQSHFWCESVKGGLCDKCLYGWGQRGARLTGFKWGSTRSRASVITELSPAQNAVGVMLIRIICCMNNTATSTHHIPRHC